MDRGTAHTLTEYRSRTCTWKYHPAHFISPYDNPPGFRHDLPESKGLIYVVSRVKTPPILYDDRTEYYQDEFLIGILNPTVWLLITGY